MKVLENINVKLFITPCIVRAKEYFMKPDVPLITNHVDSKEMKETTYLHSTY